MVDLPPYSYYNRQKQGKIMTLKKSAQLFEQNKGVLAGGVSSDIRKAELPHPLYFESGEGSRIKDIDGNEYIDYILGQGPLLLGHNPRDRCSPRTIGKRSNFCRTTSSGG